MSEMCIGCDKWKENRTEALMKCESIFDAADNMKKFEEECAKTCPFKNNKNNVKNS